MDSDKIKAFDHGTNPVNPLVTLLSQRSYRIGSDQGIVFLAAAVIDRRYRWVVTLEPLSVVEIDELPVVLRRVSDRSGVRGSWGFGDRSGMVETKSLSRLLVRRHDAGIFSGCRGLIALVGCQGGCVLAMTSSTRRNGENETSLTPSIVVSVMSWRNSGFQCSQVGF
jgi:hypothetical protein